MERGKLFAVSRAFVRLKLGRWTVEVPPPEGPTVYVCRHGNMMGPIATLSWLPFPARPWVLHVFTQRETCQAQYRDYTFSARFGLPKPLAAVLAWAVSGYVSALMKSLCAIPVYRGTARIGETFRETAAALRAGDPVLVFPDVDYTSSGGDIGEVYDGFLLIERFWRRVSDEPVRFVPLALDRERRRIAAGPPVRFNPSKKVKEDLPRVREALREAMNRGPDSVNQ